jgi:hypothetical protein
VISDRSIFGQDGDAAFAFEVVGVHHALYEMGVLAEDSALAQHGVDQGGLAVVNMRDDGDVTNILIHICAGTVRRTERQSRSCNPIKLRGDRSNECSVILARGGGIRDGFPL